MGIILKLHRGPHAVSVIETVNAFCCCRNARVCTGQCRLHHPGDSVSYESNDRELLRNIRLDIRLSTGIYRLSDILSLQESNGSCFELHISVILYKKAQLTPRLARDSATTWRIRLK